MSGFWSGFEKQAKDKRKNLKRGALSGGILGALYGAASAKKYLKERRDMLKLIHSLPLKVRKSSLRADRKNFHPWLASKKGRWKFFSPYMIAGSALGAGAGGLVGKELD